MRIHAIEKIAELKKLRRTGYSIQELMVKFSMPKTTVWHHVHAVDIAPKYLEMWSAKRGGSTKRTLKNWELAKQQACQLLQGEYRELLIAISMLYWAEGSKKDCEFINSNGKMIRCYLHILRTALNVRNEFIHPTMRIFTGMNREECLRYWSKITKIPKQNFTVRLNDGGTRGRTQHGMCRITIRKGSMSSKIIHSLIEQVSNEILNISPRSSTDRIAHS